MIAHRSGRGSSGGSIDPALAALNAVESISSTRAASDGPAVSGNVDDDRFTARGLDVGGPGEGRGRDEFDAGSGGGDRFEPGDETGVGSREVGRRQDAAALERWSAEVVDQHRR